MKRPLGVTLMGVLLLVQGLFLIALALAITNLMISSERASEQQLLVVDIATFTVSDWLLAVALGMLGIFIVISGIGVLRLRQWAWLVAMILQGWTLAVVLFDYFTRGTSSYFTMLLGVIIVFYLNSRGVRQTFDLAHTHEVTGTSAPLGMSSVDMRAEGEIAPPRQRLETPDTVVRRQ